MNARWKIFVTSTLVACLLLAGCATDRRNQSLEKTLDGYAAAVRWGSFEQAAAFLGPKYRKQHPLTDLEMARYHQVRVSEYDAGSGPVPQSKFVVHQVVRIGLINVHSQSERTIIDRQTWTYDPKTDHWWLTSGLPDITPRH